MDEWDIYTEGFSGGNNPFSGGISSPNTDAQNDSGKIKGDYLNRKVFSPLGARNPLKGLFGGGGGGGANIPDPTMPGLLTAPTGPTSGVSVQGAPTAFGEWGIPTIVDPRQALIAQGPQNEFRGQQMTLAQQLSEQAAGRGPSLASEQLKLGQEAAQRATFAQLASQRGGANPLAARTAMQQSSNLQAQAARDSALARIQEQMGARQQLAGVLEGGRGQDIGLATSQAQLEQQANLAKYQGDLEMAVTQGKLSFEQANTMFNAAQQTAIQNSNLAAQYQDLQAKYAAMGLDADKANQMAALEFERLKQSGALGAAEISAKKQASQQGLFGQGLGALGTLGAAGINKGLFSGGGSENAAGIGSLAGGMAGEGGTAVGTSSADIATAGMTA